MTDGAHFEDQESAVGPLRGLRVLDVGGGYGAVTPSGLLADLGADVVAVVDADGDGPEQIGPLKGGVSLLEKTTGRNKRHVRWSGDDEERSARLHALAERADVAIMTGRSYAGMSARDVAAAHPHLVVVAVTPYGASDPGAQDVKDPGRVAEAFGGQTHACGEPQRTPLHPGFPIGTSAVATIGALGAVAGVLERERAGTGLGQFVDLAAYEAVLRFMEFLPVFFQQTGFRNERTGNSSSYQVPVATWRTADDKWVTFSGNTNEIVHRLYRAMGREELVDDERFATNDARVANRVVVEKTLADWARSHNRTELEAICEAHAVPLGIVFGMDDIFADENYRARGTIVEVDDPDLGRCRVAGVVPRFSRTPGAVRQLGGIGRATDVETDAIWSSRRSVESTEHTEHTEHSRQAADRERAGSAFGPLAGIRVLDIGQILAGPFIATLLGDLGADVVKVEKPNGDDFRRQSPLHRGTSLWWKSTGRNKRAISLDLKEPDDRRLFLDLVARADIVTANFVPGTLERLGLGYEDLRAANPAIIVVSVSGFGQVGPFRTRRAFGRNAEAYGGLSQVSGYADSPPIPTGFPVADGLSAAFGALGAVASLYERSRNGQGAGQHVDVALYETVFRLLGVPALMYDQLGVVPGKSSFGTAAGEVFCLARSADDRWMSATKWGVGPVDFEDDPMGSASPDRRRDIDAITQYIGAHTSDQLASGIDRPFGFTVTAVIDPEEMLADERYVSRSSLVEVDDPEFDRVRFVGVVPRFDRTPGRILHGAPTIDADRASILEDWLGRDSGPAPLEETPAPEETPTPEETTVGGGGRSPS